MDLHWSRGFSYSDLLRSESLRSHFKRPGVYVHTDHRSGKAAYVGKATGKPDLWLRQYQHYVNCIGGLSLVPAAVGRGEPYAWTPGYKNDGIPSAILDREVVRQTVDAAFDYASKVVIYLCPLETAEAAKIAERELLWALQPLDTDSGTKSPPPSVASQFVHYCWQFPILEELFRSERGDHVFQTAPPILEERRTPLGKTTT